MRLPEYMEWKGITQADLAKQVGVTPAAVSMWINGSVKPGRRSAFAIEEATGGAVPANSWGSDEPPKKGRTRGTRRPTARARSPRRPRSALSA